MFSSVRVSCLRLIDSTKTSPPRMHIFPLILMVLICLFVEQAKSPSPMLCLMCLEQHAYWTLSSTQLCVLISMSRQIESALARSEDISSQLALHIQHDNIIPVMGGANNLKLSAGYSGGHLL